MVNLNKTVILLLCCLFMFLGCENKEAEKLKSEPEGLSLALSMSEEENISLNERIIGLEKTINELTGELEDTKANADNRELLNQEEIDWASHLVKSFGPSLWSISQYDNPLPLKHFKTATPAFLIKQLNIRAKKTELPEIVLVIIKDKTAFLKVIDDNHLTQGMGTSGAAAFLKSVAYTLTSINEIKCVEFEFSAGDHAYPTELCP